MTRKVKLVLFILLCWVSAAIAQPTQVPTVYKLTRLSANDAAVSCKTGKAPLVDTKTDGTYVIVTCE